MVAVEHLVGMFITVVVREEVLCRLSDISTAQCGVGLLGHGGNKGAVAVRFKLDNTSACFVCSHLASLQLLMRMLDMQLLRTNTISSLVTHTQAAHRGNSDGRNTHYTNILNKISFKVGGRRSQCALSPALTPTQTAADVADRRTTKAQEHKQVPHL